MQSCQSAAGSFGMQGEQLLPESKVFEDEIFPRAEATENPAKEMTERRDESHDHGQNLIEARRIKLVPKSFILRVHKVLTRDTSGYGTLYSITTTGAFTLLHNFDGTLVPPTIVVP